MSLQKIGDYTVTRELGEGGMGKVYQALSPDGVTVAVKTVLCPAGVDARGRWETIERFQREARAARSLSHPNIVEVLDIGADEEVFFIVMEFLDGQTVRELIQLAGAIKVDRAVEIMLRVCDALACAHEQGIVHRDIKPDNIMILRSGQVKLTDLGLASILYEKGVTETGTTMGTFAYMSPEQVRGEKLDARSDIFSLGSTLYEMLAGRKAFEGEVPAAVINQILDKDPPPVQGVPQHVARTLAKCLRKDPQYRFQKVREIITGLKTPDAGLDVKKTAVLPGKKKGPPAVYSSPPPGVTAARPKATAASKKPAEARERIPDLRCPRCHEPMSRNTASCWRCGTPNPVLARRSAHKQSDSALQDAVRALKRPKKGRWLPRGR